MNSQKIEISDADVLELENKIKSHEAYGKP